MSDKIQPTHLERRATVYLRQSTIRQVHEHHESTVRQYALSKRALGLGWPAERIEVIDEDLGESGIGTARRTGFQRLAEDIAQGRIGAIFSLEVSRLARSSADWYHLLDLCGLADVLLIDEQAVYTPRDYNDRLLLGLKGTMSEAEQYWMRLRLQGGKLSKAKRGELFIMPPVGYEWNETTHCLCLDPDEQVQRAVHLVFKRFRLEGSAYAVVRYFARNGLKIPSHHQHTRELQWEAPRYGTILNILHDPIYTGAYVYGRNERHTTLVNGQIRQRRTRLPQEAWKVLLRDHHPAYLSWEEFMGNQKKLQANRARFTVPDQHGAAREGAALLQGLVLCGQCGHRMKTKYYGPLRRAYYECRRGDKHIGGKSTCWTVATADIDEAVADLFLKMVQPPEIELSLAVTREVQRQVDEVNRQWKLRLERARYEAQLAERRYKAVDPDNRVVARTLEREWNERLLELEEIEHEHQKVLRREKLDLNDGDRAKILALAKDLPGIWQARSTTHADRKNLLRILVREVVLSPIDMPERMIRIQVVWLTGGISDISIPRRSKTGVRKTPLETHEYIRKQFEDNKSDGEIADELNQLGMHSGTNRPWSMETVSRIRSHYGLRRPPLPPPTGRQPARRADGLYSVRGVAKRFKVTEGIVYYWIAKGWLKGAEGGGQGRPWWFKLDDQAVKRLVAIKARGYGAGRRHHSETRPPEEAHYA